MVAITQLSAEKNLPRETVLSAVEAALVSAYKRDAFAPNQDILVKIHPSTGEVKVYVRKTVVETVSDLGCEMSLTEAEKWLGGVVLGDVVEVESTPRNAGRIAAQTAKQVILQRLHEAEHHAIYEEFVGREGDIFSGVVQRIDHWQIYIDLGRAEAVLPASEQVSNERYRLGQRLKLYLLEVAQEADRRPQIIVSRSHRNLLRRLFELEIPEIHNGNVELKSVAREAGHRSKVAVVARQKGVDPVGCCVGLRGIRIQNIVSELNGERIDVVQWYSDSAKFIASALSPAQVLSVKLNESENTAIVVVPDRQFSLAIGREGQNARLAARLTGWRIDIKSASTAKAEEESLQKEEVAIGEVETLPEEEPLPQVESPPEVVPLPELISPVEPQVTEEADKAEVTEPLASYDFASISEALSTKQSAGETQLRFAEDILADRSKKPEKKSRKKAIGEGKAKPKRIPRKQESYLEDEELS